MLEAPRAAPGAGRRSVVATGGSRRARDRPARRPGRRGRRAAGAAACARLLGRRADRAGGGAAACPLRQALTRTHLPPQPQPPALSRRRRRAQDPGRLVDSDGESLSWAASPRHADLADDASFPATGALRACASPPPPLPPPARAAPGRSGTHAHLRERRPAERPARRTGGRGAAGLPRAHDCLTAWGAALLGSVRRAYAYRSAACDGLVTRACGAGAPADLHEPPPAPRHEAMMSTRADAAAWTLERLADAQWAGIAPHAPLEPPSPPPPPPPAEPEEGAQPRGARPENVFFFRLHRDTLPALHHVTAEPAGGMWLCLGPCGGARAVERAPNRARRGGLPSTARVN